MPAVAGLPPPLALRRSDRRLGDGVESKETCFGKGGRAVSSLGGWVVPGVGDKDMSGAAHAVAAVCAAVEFTAGSGLSDTSLSSPSKWGPRLLHNDEDREGEEAERARLLPDCLAEGELCSLVDGHGERLRLRFAVDLTALVKGSPGVVRSMRTGLTAVGLAA
eukprot:m.328653 g.328653  ORF g.328653 m.328653 type:complete len:163 (-) comp56045_c0_seq1:83-571(-)